jgi:RNA polymerase sigma-70 factor (ECF subfamily)
MDNPDAEARSLLEEISTRWSLIANPLQFVLRYSPAVRRYLRAILRDSHDADDVAQTFLTRMVGRPFTPDRVSKGRFRDYLKAVLRNAAIDFFRQSGRAPTEAADLSRIAAPETEQAADRAWLAEWRSCLLERTWEGLDRIERESPESLAFTVLRLAVDHPDEDSPALAARASAMTGRPIRPEALRKQLSRARRRFAQILVDEIKKTLERPGAAEVVEELAHLELMEYVRDYLPEPYRGTS